MQSTSLILIPYWVEAVLKRNKLGLKDVLNYDTIRPIMSMEDLSGLLSLQHDHNIQILKNIYTSILLSSWDKTINQKYKVELDSTVLPLSYSEEIIKDVSLRFNSNDEINDENTNTFKVVDIDRNTLCIVLNKNFSSNILNKNTERELITSILKVFYVYNKVNDVSKNQIFTRYLESLNTQTLVVA